MTNLEASLEQLLVNAVKNALEMAKRLAQLKQLASTNEYQTVLSGLKIDELTAKAFINLAKDFQDKKTQGIPEIDIIRKYIRNGEASRLVVLIETGEQEHGSQSYH